MSSFGFTPPSGFSANNNFRTHFTIPSKRSNETFFLNISAVTLEDGNLAINTRCFVDKQSGAVCEEKQKSEMEN